MTTFIGNRRSLEDRLRAAAEKRLGVPVQFVRWLRDIRTGADVPVFDVPADAIERAVALGLTVEKKDCGFGNKRTLKD